jgi:hypothetical protein
VAEADPDRPARGSSALSCQPAYEEIERDPVDETSHSPHQAFLLQIDIGATDYVGAFNYKLFPAKLVRYHSMDT